MNQEFRKRNSSANQRKCAAVDLLGYTIKEQETGRRLLLF